MRDYFEHTGEVRYVSASFLDSVLARAARSRPWPRCSAIAWRTISASARYTSAPTRRGLEKLRNDLAEVLRLMDLANMYQKRIDHHTWETIRTEMASRPVQRISDAAGESFPLVAQPAGTAGRPAAAAASAARARADHSGHAACPVPDAVQRLPQVHGGRTFHPGRGSGDGVPGLTRGPSEMPIGTCATNGCCIWLC